MSKREIICLHVNIKHADLDHLIPSDHHRTFPDGHFFSASRLLVLHFSHPQMDLHASSFMLLSCHRGTSLVVYGDGRMQAKWTTLYAWRGVLRPVRHCYLEANSCQFSSFSFHSLFLFPTQANTKGTRSRSRILLSVSLLRWSTVERTSIDASVYRCKVRQCLQSLQFLLCLDKD